MKQVNDHIRSRLYEQCRIVDSKAGNATLAELRRSEWSPEFEKLMRNRLIVGAARYGRMDGTKGFYDYIGSIISRARKYWETGNDELLVDIANCAMLEFVKGGHPNKHFASEDDGEHIKEIL